MTGDRQRHPFDDTQKVDCRSSHQRPLLPPARLATTLPAVRTMAEMSSPCRRGCTSRVHTSTPRQRRRAHGLSQRELALRAGTRQATISRIENGHEAPTVQRLDQLVTALGERLELHAVPLDAERPADEVHADQATSMTARLAAGVAIRVVGLDDLICMQRASGRPQDLRDIANLSPPAEDDE